MKNTDTDAIVVAVMGPTGSGKSSFIKSVTGCHDIVIGEGLESETSEVQPYTLRLEGVNFILVDTPGLDDSRGLDHKIVDDILRWLESSYQQGTRLNGLIYLHRISDPRMSGTAMSNLRLFRQLCGNDNLKNVVLGTTFWSRIDGDVALSHERELSTKEEYWKTMLSKGSRMVRISKEHRATNLQVLMDMSRRNGKMVVEAQREMSAGVQRTETKAARQLNSAAVSASALASEVQQFRVEQEARLASEKARFQELLAEKDAARRALAREHERIDRERREDAARCLAEEELQLQRKRERESLDTAFAESERDKERERFLRRQELASRNRDLSRRIDELRASASASPRRYHPESYSLPPPSGYMPGYGNAQRQRQRHPSYTYTPDCDCSYCREGTGMEFRERHCIVM